MTLRLCVIGNSHLGAFKLGWDQLQASHDARITAFMPTFFGAPRDGVKNVALREGRLVPTTEAVAEHFLRMSGGKREIDPAEYDAFLLVGLGASMKRVLRLYRSYRWFGTLDRPDTTAIGRTFARDFLAEGYAGTRLALMAQLLASATTKPIYVTPEPYWAAMPLAKGKKTTDFGWATAAASGDGEAIAQMFVAAMSQALHPFGKLIWQPELTVEQGIVTKAKYNKGASKFISGDGEESDAAHMNADYGAVWWKSAAAELVATTAIPETARPRARKSA